VIVLKSHKHKISAKILTAILMQESRYNLAAINKATSDFGISQINIKNIRHMKLDKAKLLTSMEYSVEAGAQVLSTYTRYQKKEPLTWLCRYNAGNRPLIVIKKPCMNYLAAVQPWL
jgi:hypothetical protein